MIALLLISTLIVLTEGSAIAPFISPFFSNILAVFKADTIVGFSCPLIILTTIRFIITLIFNLDF